MYSARIVADSISPSGVRITSIEGVFARYLLAEINTHRRFSRNSASSRAIPVLVRAKSVWSNPFVPTFTKNKPGMAADEALEDSAAQAEQIWRSMASVSAMAAEKMARLEVHKQQANRILEPYVWHTALLTSTEWENFLNLRDHPGASEMQKFARVVRELLENSVPKKLEVGQWHLPYMDDVDEFSSVIREMDMPPHEVLAAISVARCAAISFERQYVKKTVVAYLDRHDEMCRNGHWSPFEHQAVVASHSEIINYATFRPADKTLVKVTDNKYSAVGEIVPVGIGNFDVPWLQYRKLFANEAVFPRHGQETL